MSLCKSRKKIYIFVRNLKINGRLYRIGKKIQTIDV